MDIVVDASVSAMPAVMPLARVLQFPGFRSTGRASEFLHLLQRAEAAGYSVLMLTVDAPVKLATFQLPGAVQAVNLERPLTANPPPPNGSEVFDGWMAQAPTWDDLVWLREQVRMPLILKGILHPDDAERAIGLGFDGLVVSNHGGRVLDGTPASLDVLQVILTLVAGRVPALLDSGIGDGRVVFKALQAGALGVAHVIRLLRDELELAMALCGWRTLNQRRTQDSRAG